MLLGGNGGASQRGMVQRTGNLCILSTIILHYKFPIIESICWTDGCLLSYSVCSSVLSLQLFLRVGSPTKLIHLRMIWWKAIHESNLSSSDPESHSQDAKIGVRREVSGEVMSNRGIWRRNNTVGQIGVEGKFAVITECL